MIGDNKGNTGLTGLFMLALVLNAFILKGSEQTGRPELKYTFSMAEPASHLFKVTLSCEGFTEDTLDFIMPQWMPGYYQIMKYSDAVSDFGAYGEKQKQLEVIKTGKNSWKVVRGRSRSVNINYNVLAGRNFVASNFLDTTHAYIVPAATFMFINGHLNSLVRIKIFPFPGWKDIATGLTRVPGTTDEFLAENIDILYDSPLLLGNLDQLPSFEVNGIKHYFKAYKPGNFNRDLLISNLQKGVKEATDLIGDIPYNEYTFIGIGPGYGGIEHLNNSTVSFDGNGLDKPDAMTDMLKYLVHEYFHNFNVKRIRPYELGPFDYNRGNRTNLLWVSEGLTVYYEYMLVRRAGLMTDEELLASIGENINTIENDEGRHYQSLIQSSYETWDDGPFGNKPGSQDRSISYYEKGPIAGLILDFSIRNATQSKKSLDDVMRFLYRHYYKEQGRGFTDAEFQRACEEIAGLSLSREFEYVNTTKDIDYSKYLSCAGLRLTEAVDNNNGKKIFKITRLENSDPSQMAFFRSWSGD
jgi:predicted metalloprotease with PDZ domain